jgi:hypothetical protein
MTPACGWTNLPAHGAGRDRKLRVINTRLDEGTGGDPVSVLVVEAA